MRSTNVFFVESPLQALSAIEAKSLDENSFNILIVSYQHRKNSQNNKQLFKIVNGSTWEQIIVLKKVYGVPKKLQNLLLLLRLYFAYRGRVSKLFIGEFRSEIMHLSRGALNPEQTFLLDDGAVIVNVQKTYLSNGIHWPSYEVYEKSMLSSMLDFLFFSIFKNKKVIAQLIHIFSAFNIEPLDGQTFVKNTYAQLKKTSREKIRLEGVAYHFGSKYSEAGVISKDDELKFIEKVLKFYQGINIKLIYIPHREESTEKLDLILGKGIVVKPLFLPAEVYFSEALEIPSYISSAYSTTINNLSAMFEFDRVIAFRLDRSSINQSYADNIENVYQYYQGIKAIDIVNLG